MDTLKEILKAELEKYTGKGANCYLFPVFDDIHQTYAVTVIDFPTHHEGADLVIFARVAENHIVIEEDRTDKKLIDALLQQGIPREQIILAYESETIPDLQNI